MRSLLLGCVDYAAGLDVLEFRSNNTAHQPVIEALGVIDRYAHAAGIRRRASVTGLRKPRRKKADECAKYLVNKSPYLDYPTALAAGWPIATGVIEGACRYLVADRMDITGARWSVAGAEAVLRLRALRANQAFEP